ncbi:MAG: ring-hydroxylating dioxygenase subunit beta [Pseudomonas kuykendallii]|uniref:Ring-hydroxylating dioxygenase subunit beta n=2 Tax=Pseudomonas kuykendallii TaxID=1007099 RepID=A0A2W5D607_9PSED|nr:MAG: ring-hydroxylating dioxygenase subunit beta [Pseudomonas kuykendallii]
MNMSNAMERITVAQARQLIADYTYTIDDGVLSDWPTYFTEPCIYRITTRQNEEMIMPLSIMLCDNQAMLYDRVEAIEKANIFEPHYYRHVLSDSKVLEMDDESIRMETSFTCVRTMLDGRVTLFASGRYSDHIVLEQGRCLFRTRKVVLDSSKVDTLIAIPL